MSLGLVVSHGNRSKKISDGQYIADLATLFERRQIALGDAHVCEQFEILFTTSEAFRGQLFTLCTAISHMSEADLSGEELLDLVARALRSQSGTMPESLRARFLAGFEAWNNRSVSGEDQWPPRKKPVANVSEANFGAAGDSQEPFVQSPPPNRPAKPDGAPVRPAGVPTLQEALEKARIRGNNRPLGREPVAADAPAQLSADPNSTAIEELNTLLGEIEERMKRLRPQLADGGASLALPQAAPDPAAPAPAKVLTAEEREAAFLARHPYLRRERPHSVISPLEPDLAEAAPATVPTAPPQPVVSAVPVSSHISGELHLVPRGVVIEPEEAATSGPSIPDALRFKTYLALAVIAGIALVATPISGVIAYRYMHPLYIYEEHKPALPTPTVEEAQPAPPVAKAAAPAKSARTARKLQTPHHPPAVEVWPPDPHR